MSSVPLIISHYHHWVLFHAWHRICRYLPSNHPYNVWPQSILVCYVSLAFLRCYPKMQEIWLVDIIFCMKSLFRLFWFLLFRLYTTKENNRFIALYSIHANPFNAFEHCVGGRDQYIRFVLFIYGIPLGAEFCMRWSCSCFFVIVDFWVIFLCLRRLHLRFRTLHNCAS